MASFVSPERMLVVLTFPKVKEFLCEVAQDHSENNSHTKPSQYTQPKREQREKQKHLLDLENWV